MRNIAFVALFAASLAAQQKQEKVIEQPQVQLAEVIAVEEQEGDLAKAEQLYRAAAADEKLSPATRDLARRRLAALLQKLGRVEEAKAVLAAAGKGVVVSLDDVTNQVLNQGQDAEREKQLRLQARELLQRAMTAKRSAAPSSLPGFSEDDAAQLLWIGQAAVPEVLAAIESIPPALITSADGKSRWARDSRQTQQLGGLFAFLWRVGGTRAAAFLVAAAGQSELAEAAASGAIFAREIDIDAPEVRAFLEHDDWQIALATLQHKNNEGVANMLSPADLVTIAERGRPAMRAFVLRRLTTTRYIEQDLLARLHTLVRSGLSGTDPDYGAAAESYLTCAASQQSTTGLVLLLQQLPELHRRGAHVDWGQNVQSPPGHAPLVAADFGALLDAIDLAVAEIGVVDRDASVPVRWLTSLMVDLISALPQEQATGRGLAWWDAGYDVGLAFAGKVTTENAAQLLQRFERRTRPQDPARFLDYFDGVTLPPTVYDQLARLADDPQHDLVRGRLLMLMAKTGNEQAVDRILAAWRADPEPDSFAASCLLQLARRNQAPAVLAAMRSMVDGVEGTPVPEGTRVALLLALLSFGDEQALQYVATLPSGASGSSSVHPYGQRRKPLTLFQYLIYDDPDAPHGFTVDQIVPVMRTLVEQDERGPNHWQVERIDDRYLVEFAEHAKSYGSDWQRIAFGRLSSRISAGETEGPLFDWFERIVADPDGVSLGGLDRRIVEHFRDQLRSVIDGEYGGASYGALVAFVRWGEDLDYERLAANRNAKVRAMAADRARDGKIELTESTMLRLLADAEDDVRKITAEYAGATVSKAAVPALINLLRDPDQHVRQAAADALTKIRFYHEQQAHWDRVLKGLDASPASAMEKLLLQAKPGAARQQRLLAITSLGTLRAPEALPFLIEWTQDDDAEVAAQAKAAITAIHLNPRK